MNTLKFVELSVIHTDGVVAPRLVNISQAVMISLDVSGGSTIFFSARDVLNVVETPEQIMGMIHERST